MAPSYTHDGGMMFKINDRVRLTETGKAKYASQARDSDGTVKADATSAGWISVRWDSGHQNCYKAADIELLNPPKAQKPQKEKNMAGKEKVYKDREGDQLEVDTFNSNEYVYFTTAEDSDTALDDGQIVRLTREDVKKIRKQLGKWLDRTATTA